MFDQKKRKWLAPVYTKYIHGASEQDHSQLTFIKNVYEINNL